MLLPLLPTPFPATAQDAPRSLDSVRVLRISVTDRCNLRCTYCMPAEPLDWLSHGELLTFDEIVRVVRAAAALGVSRIKLTGGEPTVRRGIVELVRMLKRIDGISDLSMTTNGVLLRQLARPLKDAGLHRLTISLDTLCSDRFRRITRGGSLTDVLDGLALCRAIGFGGLKINCVAMRGQNDDEFADLAALALPLPVTVRFIEYMPFGQTAAGDSTFIAEHEIRAAIERALGPLEPVDRASEVGVGPSTVYRFAARRAAGRVGFISAMSAPFCATCNRLRLTADGRLCACLFNGGEVNLRWMLRDSVVTNDRSGDIKDLMAQCVAQRPPVHAERGCMQMSAVGG